jgi:hypothetical protein
MTRLIGVVFLCFGIYGCAVGVMTSNLENIPSKDVDSTFLRSLRVVVHGYTEPDTKSWLVALKDFTNPENVTRSPDVSNDLPVLYLDSRRPKDMSPSTVSNLWFILSVLSFAIIPAYEVQPMQATFTLHMAEGQAPIHAEYAYNRYEISWLPLVFVGADFGFLIMNGWSNEERVYAEEKRRLLLRFVRDAERDLGSTKPM